MTKKTFQELLRRKSDSHKGDYGRCLLIGGSRNMPGAISLSGLAALRSGAGLVAIATAIDAQPVVAGFHPALMTLGLDNDVEGFICDPTLDRINEICQWATCAAVGPGIGQTTSTQLFVSKLLGILNKPKVIDADGLNAIAANGIENTGSLPGAILTPHPGEFKRLFPEADTNDRKSMENVAVEKSRQHSVTIVLKGHKTLVTDGEQSFHNNTGNPGMATAGSGDVLTGIIVGLLAQGLSTWEAAKHGVRIHGRAGDVAAEKSGQASLICTDIIDAIPKTMLEVN